MACASSRRRCARSLPRVVAPRCSIRPRRPRRRAMRLELGSFPVTHVRFGQVTRWKDGALTIDRDAVLAAVRDDALVASASLEIARPGESVRIWPVRDVGEPRIKVSGPGAPYRGSVCQL